MLQNNAEAQMGNRYWTLVNIGLVPIAFGKYITLILVV